MRDARAQGRQERGAGRNCALAGRRSREFRAIEAAVVIDAYWRLAGAIALASLAFIIWNVGTRSPLALVRDIRRAGRAPRAIFFGLISFTIGLIFAIAALVLVLPAIVDFDTDLWLTLLLMFLVALSIELLIGPDVRKLATGNDTTASR